MEILRRYMHIAMQFALFFIHRYIHKSSHEIHINHVQECVKLINSTNMDWDDKFALLAYTVYNYGMTMHVMKNNQTSFVVTCVLHKAFSGWCVVSIDLDDQILVQKKFRNFTECEYNRSILSQLRILNKFSDFKIMSNTQVLLRPEEWIITISFPARILPQCREVGLMF